jgi:peptidoglycan/xylan/chitin deacetylase (PgdA/CDA1 family)
MGFRSSVKLGLATVAARSGALGLMRRLGRPRVHIFGYHRFVPDVGVEGDAQHKMRQLCVSTASFTAHLDHLARNYEVCALEDAIAMLAGEREMPGRDVAVITFDDGYLDVLENAAPILAERGLPASMFVTSGVVDTGRPLPHDRLFALISRARERGVRLLGSAVPDRLVWPLARADQELGAGDLLGATDAVLCALGAEETDLVAGALAARVGEPTGTELPALCGWSELDRLIELGFTIGAHGDTHGLLALENDERLIEELAVPRATIARHIGIPPSVIAYPGGRFDQRVIEAARAAGYVAALTTEDRRNTPGCDLFRLGRKCLVEDHGLGEDGIPARALVAAQLDGLFATLGLARAVPGDRDMETPWL